MTHEDLDLEHLPLQKHLIDSACAAFYQEPNAVAAVLLGSLAAGKGDRISDADIVVFTKNRFHCHAESCFAIFEKGKEIFYCLDGFHNKSAFFKKYIFRDLTSAEIHCIDVCEPFPICSPYIRLFDKEGVIEGRLTDEPPPSHEDFPVYTSGDSGLIWELFDCIKWLSRDDTELAKSYLKKLALTL